MRERAIMSRFGLVKMLFIGLVFIVCLAPNASRVLLGLVRMARAKF